MKSRELAIEENQVVPHDSLDVPLSIADEGEHLLFKGRAHDGLSWTN
jgi:hypothetical protein